MELFQLKYFETVAETQHFTRAAEYLHISQPSLSKAISNLESELGVPLFERERKNVYLTEYGKALLVHARRILTEADDAVQEIRNLAGIGGGDIYIGSCCMFAEPSRLDEYSQKMFLADPKLSLHMYMMDTDQIEGMLLNRKLDFGYSVTPSQHPQILSTALFSYHLGIVVSRDHPLSGRGAVHLNEFAEESFMCNNTSADLRDSVYELPRLAGFEPHVIFEGESPVLIGEAVAAGRGVAFISNEQHSWKQQNASMADDRIVFLQLLDDFCVRTVYLLEVRNRPLSAAAQRYRDGLITCMHAPDDPASEN